MITGAKSNEPRVSEKTTKEYYVIMDDGNPIGVCSERDAFLCLEAYAKTKTASICRLNVYVYLDKSGPHLITIRKVPRMKIVR